MLLSVMAAAAGVAHGQLAADDVPAFAVRGRVTRLSGTSPDPAAKFALHLGTTAKPAEMRGQEWSDWVTFDRQAVEENLKGYPAVYLRGWPLVTRAGFAGIADPTQVEAELRFDGDAAAIPLSGELFGPSLGILVWRDADRTPRADTMAGYNRRYWKSTEGIQLAADVRPKRFPIVERFIGGDDDRIAWREGIEQLARAGFTAIMLPPDARIRKLLAEAGHHRTAWAVYSPPGYAFDFDPALTPESIVAWGRDQAKPYLDAGYAAADMAVYAMSDEPGWYYPLMIKTLGGDPESLARFRAYLAGQKLEPRDLGQADWAQVMPSADRRAASLEERRLFYWTMRFFPHDSAVHFARCSKAIEEAFYPGLPVVTNWNFFSGRSYVPGDVANNQDKNDPRAGMGGHDWLEFGRLRGGSMLWTEDWFGDAQAWQWSFSCAKLRSAAAKGNVTFGSYVIPRTAGDRAEGLLQKILSVVGHGGKALKYFVFGPEYNFPTNCYSERHELLPKLAEAHGMIAAAEDQLWFGVAPAAQVAIVSPLSAQFWDARDADCPRMIHDATNTNLNAHTVDYMAEVFDLYLALQHANIPADFVEEDDLAGPGLAAYRVLYLTEPNVPREYVEPLLAWVRAGGTLVTVRGAAGRDRYDDPCTALADALGFRETANERVLVPNLAAAASRTVRCDGRELQARLAWGAVEPRAAAAGSGPQVVATFDDGSPAVLETTLGNGKAVHFAWLPGISYWLSSTATKDRLPVDFSAALRDAIVAPIRDRADFRPVVEASLPLVETPVLTSSHGMAVTLLNWTGEPVPRCELAIRAPASVSRVVSVRHGNLDFTIRDGIVRVALPLGGADILCLR